MFQLINSTFATKEKVMKKFVLLFCGVAFALFMNAVPAKRVWITVSQKDGTQLKLMPQGDERLHFFITEDNVPVVAQNGAYYYANSLGFGMSATTTLAHNAAERSNAEQAFVESVENVESETKQFAPALTGADVPQYVSYTGKKRGIIILVEFTDKSFSYSHPRELFDSIANYKGYSNHGYVGSISNYFADVSNNQFDVSFDVYGPVKLEQDMKYYGQPNGSSNDSHVGTMVAEAILGLPDSVNWKNYDWNGDNVVDQVCVVYAGYSQAEGADENTIWPNEYSLYWSDYAGVIVRDKCTINKYSVSQELSGTSGTALSGIGVFCHEFSHCLGLMDHYDTGTSGNYGMGNWDIMCTGSYNGDGFCPAGYTAYERAFCGWLTPITLSDSTDVTGMKALTDGGNAYAIYNDNNNNEYYMLENRQQTSWDKELYGKGLLIYHVDYDSKIWANNAINRTKDHQRMAVIPADNSTSYAYNNVKHDIYPYSTNTSFTNTSKPAATVYNVTKYGNYFLNKPVTDIQQASDGTISFKFRAMSEQAVGIDDVKADASLYGKSVKVYNLNGTEVKEISNFDGNLNLNKGVYILVGENGKPCKVSIH
jgi:immune inhibitor A